MGAQGTTTVNFGAFPGGYDTSVVITGQASIVSGSLVEAWIRPEATADHTADEHLVEHIKVIAGNISAGVGFTIYAFNDTHIIQKPDGNMVQQSPSPTDAGGVGVAANYLGRVGGQINDQVNSVPRVYGQFTVAWVWN